jgi:hypothetical protein
MILSIESEKLVLRTDCSLHQNNLPWFKNFSFLFAIIQYILNFNVMLPYYLYQNSVKFLKRFQNIDQFYVENLQVFCTLFLFCKVYKKFQVFQFEYNSKIISKCFFF